MKKQPCMAMVVSSSHHQENLDTARGGYECKTCGKRFNSYQALGGHQGIHKRVRPPPIDVNYDECELRLDIAVDPNNNNKSSFGLHRCKQCTKEFETGQALGGHMRRHRVEKDLVVLMQQEDVVRRQRQASSDEEGKSYLMMEVSRLKAEAEDYRRREKMMMRSELMLAAREWRLSII